MSVFVLMLSTAVAANISAIILNRHQVIKLVVCVCEHRARVSILSANKHDYVHRATYEERTSLNRENHVSSPNSISFSKMLLIPIPNTQTRCVDVCSNEKKNIYVCKVLFTGVLDWTFHFRHEKRQPMQQKVL